jgi:glycosyltransferase involved in cell wall biosynthesis
VVVYIITKLELGGAQKVCLSLLKNVAARGMKTILISGPHGPLVPQAQLLCDEVYLLPSLQREVGLFSLFKEGLAFLHMTFVLWQLRRKYGEITVHTHSTKAGIMGRWAAWFAGAQRIVHTVHGFGFHAYQMAVVWWLHYVLEYVTSWVTSAYVCVSSVDKAQGEELLPYFERRSNLIRAAIEWDTFTVSAQEVRPARLLHEAKSQRLRIGTISCFKPQKNLIHLFEAVRRLVNDDGIAVDLEVVGDGEQAPALFAWTVKHGLQEVITFRGWQYEVAPLMREWDVFALSSLWEGLPCAIIEARLLQLPVVAYNVGGIAEVITDKHNGILLQPGDVNGLYQALKTVALDARLRQSLAKADNDLTPFSDSVMAQQHAALYKQL